MDDQKQDVGLGIKVKSYGPWLSKRLADHDVEQAFLNNDNYMYLALVSDQLCPYVEPYIQLRAILVSQR